MEKTTRIDIQKQIELAAESFAQILIQQALGKKNPAIIKQIEMKYGKPSK